MEIVSLLLGPCRVIYGSTPIMYKAAWKLVCEGLECAASLSVFGSDGDTQVQRLVIFVCAHAQVPFLSSFSALLSCSEEERVARDPVLVISDGTFGGAHSNQTFCYLSCG